LAAAAVALAAFFRKSMVEECREESGERFRWERQNERQQRRFKGTKGSEGKRSAASRRGATGRPPSKKREQRERNTKENSDTKRTSINGIGKYINDRCACKHGAHRDGKAEPR
jgi:hypothetical protein